MKTRMFDSPKQLAVIFFIAIGILANTKMSVPAYAELEPLSAISPELLTFH